MRFVRGCGLVAQDQDVAHRQHVPFGRVLNVPRGSIRTHQPERAFLLALLQKGLPKLRNLRLEAGRAKSSIGRPMIFSRGSPNSLPAPTLAS